MGKRELAEKVEFEKAVGLTDTISSSFLSVLKFLLAVILLPLVFGVSKGFLLKVIWQPQYIRDNFISAVGLYLVIHLFVCPLRIIYDLGQRIIGKIFSFFVPLRRVMYYCLPFYATLFFGLFLIFRSMSGYNDTAGYFIFLISFSSAMHLLITADYLKGESRHILKGDYFLSLVMVYLSVIVLLSGFLSVITDKFSFTYPFDYGYKFFIDTVGSIWKQFFIVR